MHPWLGIPGIQYVLTCINGHPSSPCPAPPFSAVWCPGSCGIHGRSRQGPGPRAQAGLSRADVDKNFLITPSLCLSHSTVFCLSLCLVVLPSIAHCLESSFASFTSCNSKCREVMEGYPHTCSTHTDKHASMKARPLKALRQQKQQAVVCGLIALTGCRIIGLDVSDRSVSGTKCTDEFLVALTMALIYRLFWSSRLCFAAQ